MSVNEWQLFVRDHKLLDAVRSSKPSLPLNSNDCVTFYRTLEGRKDCSRSQEA